MEQLAGLEVKLVGGLKTLEVITRHKELLEDIRKRVVSVEVVKEGELDKVRIPRLPHVESGDTRAAWADACWPRMGGVFQIYFDAGHMRDYLRDFMKEEMLWEVDRSSPADQIRDFVERSADLRKEIHYQEKLDSNWIAHVRSYVRRGAKRQGKRVLRARVDPGRVTLRQF